MKKQVRVCALFAIGILTTLALLIWLIGEKPSSTSSIHTTTTQIAAHSPSIQKPHKGSFTNTPTQTEAPLVQLQEKLQRTSSARGSNIDRPIITNPDGKLTLSPSLLFYFDYFLSLRSEFDFTHIVALITHDIKQQYPKPFQSEILRLFKQYAGYKTEFASQLNALTEHDMQYLLSLPNSYHEFKYGIQQQYFSESEIEALFTEYENNMSMPSHAEHKALRYQQYQQDLKQAVKSQTYDAATMVRLEKLQQQRMHWRQRLHDYALQRDAINANQGLDEASKQESVMSLQARLFTPLEQKRVQAFDRQ